MQAWSDVADRNVVRAAVLKVAYLMEPGMSSDRLQALVAYLADQDYATGELVYAANQLPKDSELDQKIRYGGRVTPADFERVIEQTRFRDRIDQLLTAEEAEALLQAEPQLTRADIESRPWGNDQTRFYVTTDALQRVFDIERTNRAQNDE